MIKPKYVTKIKQIPSLNLEERAKLQKVSRRFAFRTNEYYLSLINWDDPNDPIRRLVIPNPEELKEWGDLDVSNESNYTVAPGLEHKYEFTALLLVNDICGGFCRFCFRKRLFLNENDEVARDISQGLEYIKKHTEINNVLLTGGDPLLLSTRKLENIIRQLRQLDHVRIIRIGTKIPAFNPYRILNDSGLLEMLEKYSTPRKKIYIMVHFNHPRELTAPAVEAIFRLQKAGTIIVNQTPLLRGINDDPDVLAESMNQLSYIGVPPYYFFQGRPTLGNKPFAVPVEESLEIFNKAKMKCSGLAKRAHLVMSHFTGKIEIVGKTNGYTYFHYHRAANPEDKGRFFVFRSNPNAYWFDDYTEAIDEHSILNPFLKAAQ
ncbi:L-lysine 2,3-aminomutase [bacterium BMS3Abin05]|nr:L-lysine 2,3-aminomutase [bacterium BMS3Abin05]GBE28021.1 L-lysine 2,3-aminomutase [bacterium BMS3Bbin03]